MLLLLVACQGFQFRHWTWVDRGSMAGDCGSTSNRVPWPLVYSLFFSHYYFISHLYRLMFISSISNFNFQLLTCVLSSFNKRIYVREFRHLGLNIRHSHRHVFNFLVSFGRPTSRAIVMKVYVVCTCRLQYCCCFSDIVVEQILGLNCIEVSSYEIQVKGLAPRS